MFYNCYLKMADYSDSDSDFNDVPLLNNATTAENVATSSKVASGAIAPLAKSQTKFTLAKEPITTTAKPASIKRPVAVGVPAGTGTGLRRPVIVKKVEPESEPESESEEEEEQPESEGEEVAVTMVIPDDEEEEIENIQVVPTRASPAGNRAPTSTARASPAGTRVVVPNRASPTEGRIVAPTRASPAGNRVVVPNRAPTSTARASPTEGRIVVPNRGSPAGSSKTQVPTKKSATIVSSVRSSPNRGSSPSDDEDPEALLRKAFTIPELKEFLKGTKIKLTGLNKAGLVLAVLQSPSSELAIDAARDKLESTGGKTRRPRTTTTKYTPVPGYNKYPGLYKKIDSILELYPDLYQDIDGYLTTVIETINEQQGQQEEEEY